MSEKTVLITGCSTGIGRALSEEFHRRGFCVVATARRLESIADLEDKGVSTYALDVTDKDQVAQVVQTVADRKKRIDVLVNNAGFMLIGPAIELPIAELSQQFETNVFAALYLAQQVAPIMKMQGSGLIVNMGSISGIATTPFSAAYCASKAALHAVSDALRMELSPFNLQVMTVQPGAITSHLAETAKTLIPRVLKPESWYQPVADSIQARAEVSQVNATPVEEFAQKLVAAVMSEKPPAVVRIGKLSTYLPLMKKIMPTGMLDAKLKKKFGLNRLE